MPSQEEPEGRASSNLQGFLPDSQLKQVFQSAQPLLATGFLAST